MRVEFEFDQNKVKSHGYTMEQIVSTLKKAFLEEGFRFEEKAPILVFHESGSEDDFSNMWFIITQLVNSDWFMQCAKKCVWYDLTDNGKEELSEDVLAQAEYLIRKRA